MGENLASVARTRFHADFYEFADDGARLDESYSYVAGRSNSLRLYESRLWVAGSLGPPLCRTIKCD